MTKPLTVMPAATAAVGVCTSAAVGVCTTDSGSDVLVMQSAEEQCVRFAELGVSVALLSGRPTQRSRVCFALIATNLMSRNDLSRMG
jgi:hypothetical protein